MKVLVTGASGQLGNDCMKELRRRKHEAVGTDRSKLDITDAAAVERLLTEVSPDALIHCAAWTAVDTAEEESNQTTVHLVNVSGTEHLARVCKKLNCKMLYLSTDYVFDGTGETPHRPDDKAFHPLNVYGETKLAGEMAVSSVLERYFVVRTAWVFGQNGSNFVKTMLKLGRTHDHLRVVCDQIGTPTYTADLARLLVDMIETEKYGFYHATNEGGFLSWYDFAKEIFRQAAAMGQRDYAEDALTVTPVTTEAYGLSRAKRPFNSRLDKTKLAENGFLPLPDWRDALSRYLQELWNQE